MKPLISVEHLDHALVSAAERVHALQMAAYAQEAMLVGANRFAPLGRTLEEVRSSPERSLGAFVHGELVGVTGVESNGPTAVISSFVVDPQWQRQGVGKTLLRRLVELYGAQGLEVQTAARNLPALALYRQCGFTEVRRSLAGPGACPEFCVRGIA